MMYQQTFLCVLTAQKISWYLPAQDIVCQQTSYQFLIALAQIQEARDKLSHDLQYRTKLQGSYGDTVPVPFSNEDGVLSSPVEVLGVPVPFSNEDDVHADTMY